MLGILIDAGVIYGLTAVFGDSDVVGFGTLLLCALAIGVTNFVAFLFLGSTIGLLAFLPGMLLAGLVFLFLCQLPPGRAAAATAIFAAVRVGLYLTLASLTA